MDILEILKIALEAIRINKLRSALTALGIIIGVASIIMLISIGAGIQNYVSGQFEKLGANSLFVLPGKVQVSVQGGTPRSVNKLTFAVVDELNRSKGPYITEVSPFIEINATASHKNHNKITTFFGGPNTFFSNYGFKAKEGRLFSEADDKAGRRVAVIGQTIAKEFYIGENPIGKQILISKKNFTVIGILEAQGSAAGIDIDNFIGVPLSAARKVTGSNQVNSVYIKTSSSKTIDQAKAQVNKVLSRTLSADDFTIISQEQLLSSVLQILGVLTFALGGIAAISLIVGGVGISNIMLVSVTERTREIALRKAVGATPRDILGQFLVEAIILSLFGGIIGITIGFIGSLALSAFLKTAVPLWSVALGLGFSSAVGIVFGVAPAIRASRLEPIIALRHE